MLGLFRREGEDRNGTRIEAARARFLAGPAQPLRWRGLLEPPEQGLELLSAGLGPDLTLVALWAGHRDIAATRAAEELEDGSVVARGRAPWAYRAIATWHGPAPRPAMIIEDLDLAFPIVQPMPGGGLLAVASRCRLREDGMAERTASIYGSHGFLERNGTVGDGIEDVQVSPRSNVEHGWNAPTVRPMLGIAGNRQDAPQVELCYRVTDLDAATALVRQHDGQASEAEQKPYGVMADCVDNQGMPFQLWQPTD